MERDGFNFNHHNNHSIKFTQDISYSHQMNIQLSENKVGTREEEIILIVTNLSL